MGKPVINMSKNLNGKLNIAAVVSDKHLDLFVQTAFVGNKKGNLVTPIAEQAAINTPKASSDTVSNNSISKEDTFFGNESSLIAGSPKAWYAIVVQDSGIIISSNRVEAKALLPMILMVSGRNTSDRHGAE